MKECRKKGVKVLLALFVLSLAVLFTACPDGLSITVTLRITGDEHVFVNKSYLDIPQGSTWNAVKEKVNDSVRFFPKYCLKEWRIENEAGELVTDKTVFTRSERLYAKTQRNKITLTIAGDEHVTVNNSQLDILQESEWKKIKDQLNQAITFAPNYHLKEWRIENESGTLVTDRMFFSDSIKLYAISEPYEILLTLKGSSEVSFDTPTFGITTTGAKWSEIKALLTDKVTLINETTELTGWKFSALESDPFINDDYAFTADSEIYAISKTTSFKTDIYGTITGYEGTPTAIIFPTKIGDQKVVRIKTGLFFGATALTSIDFSPATHLKTIADSAFYQCTQLTGDVDLSMCKELTSIEMDAFYNTKITSVHLPISLQEIKNDAFSSCTELTEVDFSRCPNLTTIGEKAFKGCTGLTGTLDLTRCEKLTMIEPGSFSTTKITAVRFPDSLQEIKGNDNFDGGAFEKCAELTEVDFSRCANLTAIGGYAFRDCTGLTGTLDLTRCEKLTTIGTGSFCTTKITTVRFPASLQEIKGTNSFDGGTFERCTELTEVDFSRCANLTTIGNCVFQGCIRLAGVDFSRCPNLTTIGKKAFKDCIELAGALDLTGCEKLTTIKLGSFYNTKITTVRFPASLQEIKGTNSFDGGAFERCTELTEVDFSRCTNLTVIGGYAFKDCNWLTITLDLTGCKKLTTIEEKAFFYCIRSEIKLPPSVQTIGSGAFGAIEGFSYLCKKVLIPAAPAEEFTRIKTLVINSGYPNAQIESY